MFDQMKALGAIAGLMKNKDRVREVGERMRDRLADARLSGQAGGGAVRVVVSGRMRVREVHIDDAAVAGLCHETSRPEVERLVLEAMNDALDQAERLVRSEAARAAEELGLPSSPDIERLLSGM